MKAEARRTLLSFLVELIVYGFLIAGYFLLVLHLLGPSLAAFDFLQQGHVVAPIDLCKRRLHDCLVGRPVLDLPHF